MSKSFFDQILAESINSPLGQLNEEDSLKEASVERIANVSLWLTYLGSYLTQYDRKQSLKRHYSIYALGHYMAALNKVRAETKSIANSDDPDDIQRLIKSLKKNFIFEGGKFSLPPLNMLMRQITKYLDTGKVPKMTTSK